MPVLFFQLPLPSLYQKRNPTERIGDMTAKLPEAVVEENLKSIPMKKLGKVEDVANLVRFLASDDASYITGQVICVDGGMAM